MPGSNVVDNGDCHHLHQEFKEAGTDARIHEVWIPEEGQTRCLPKCNVEERNIRVDKLEGKCFPDQGILECNLCAPQLPLGDPLADCLPQMVTSRDEDGSQTRANDQALCMHM